MQPQLKVELQNQWQSLFPVVPIMKRDRISDTASGFLKKNMIEKFPNTNYKISGAADARNNHSSHLIETAQASASIWWTWGQDV